MNIVIYGTGGVGGYFGARLSQAGNNVTFIARGKHLEAIQKNGLQLKSHKGDYLVKPANVTSTITDIKNIDLILVFLRSFKSIAPKTIAWPFPCSPLPHQISSTVYSLSLPAIFSWLLHCIHCLGAA